MYGATWEDGSPKLLIEYEDLRQALRDADAQDLPIASLVDQLKFVLRRDRAAVRTGSNTEAPESGGRSRQLQPG